MKKESVLILLLLLLKPTTKTSQPIDIAIMIYYGRSPVLKNVNSLFLAIICIGNSMICSDIWYKYE